MDKTPPREITPEPINNDIKEVDQFVWQIPICCRENWDNCKHQVNRDIKKTKRNIGL